MILLIEQRCSVAISINPIEKHIFSFSQIFQFFVIEVPTKLDPNHDEHVKRNEPIHSSRSQVLPTNYNSVLVTYTY